LTAPRREKTHPARPEAPLLIEQDCMALHEKLLDDAGRLAKVRTKREAVEIALREHVKRTFEPYPTWKLTAGYIAARIGKGLAESDKTGRTVDLLLAGSAIRAGAELWSLTDDHYRDVQALLKRGEVKVAGSFRIRWLP
jgi:hypothetical protein